MIWVKLGADAICWSAWFWQHRDEFGPVLKKLGDIGDYAQAAIANPDGAVRRIGNTIVFGRADGGERVLAFIEQTQPQLSSIERAVDGLQAGQQVLSASLGSLQTLSMVTLGLTALTPIVLLAQFVALSRRLTALQKQIADLDKKISAQIIAKLRAGLAFLQQGMEFLDREDCGNAHSRLNQALPFCTESMKVFGELLGNELKERRVHRDELRLLGRHLSVALAGVAGCQIGLGQDQHPFSQSGEELELLKQAARWVFQDTVGQDPAPFLMPAMKEHGVTITFLTELFRQARDAGVVDACPNSPSEWFEQYRDRIFKEQYRDRIFKVSPPLLWTKQKCLGLKARLHEAMSAIEETNRVCGLSRLVQETKGHTLEVMDGIKKVLSQQSAEECPYVAWGLT
jgi:hypothetical protein